MESQIKAALENLQEAILFEMNNMSEKHRITLKKLLELQKKYNLLKDAKIVVKLKSKMREK